MWPFSRIPSGHNPFPPCLPLGEGGLRVSRKRETDEGYLPLPMGEVPRRGGEGMFTLSVTP